MLEILKINKFSVLELFSSLSNSFTDTWKKNEFKETKTLLGVSALSHI